MQQSGLNAKNLRTFHHGEVGTAIDTEMSHTSRARVARSRRDAATVIARNATRNELATNMLWDKNKMPTDVDRRMRYNKGTKEEPGFNEMAKVEVEEICRSTLRHKWRLDTEERRHGTIGFSAQLECIDRAESVGWSAQLWFPICKKVDLTVCGRINLLICMNTTQKTEDLLVTCFAVY